MSNKTNGVKTKATNDKRKADGAAKRKAVAALVVNAGAMPAVKLPPSRNGKGAKSANTAKRKRATRTPKSMVPKEANGAMPKYPTESDAIADIPRLLSAIADERNAEGKAKYPGKHFSEALKCLKAGLGQDLAKDLPDAVFAALKLTQRERVRAFWALPENVSFVNQKGSTKPVVCVTDTDKRGFTFRTRKQADELADAKRQAQSATDMSDAMRTQADKMSESYADADSETKRNAIVLRARKLKKRYIAAHKLTEGLAVKPFFPPLVFDGPLLMLFEAEDQAFKDAVARKQAEQAEREEKRAKGPAVDYSKTLDETKLRIPKGDKADEVKNLSASDSNVLANMRGEMDTFRDAMKQLMVAVQSLVPAKRGKKR